MLMRPLEIREVMNGYVVQAGCQTLVFRNITDLCAELKRYAEDPYRVEQEYLAKYRTEKGDHELRNVGENPVQVQGTAAAGHYARAEQAHQESQRFMQGPRTREQHPSPTVAAYGLSQVPGLEPFPTPDAQGTTTFR